MGHFISVVFPNTAGLNPYQENGPGKMKLEGMGIFKMVWFCKSYFGPKFEGKT